MKYSTKWEKLGWSTLRLKIYGGWLVKSGTGFHNGGISIIFIKDPTHEWELEKGDKSYE